MTTKMLFEKKPYILLFIAFIFIYSSPSYGQKMKFDNLGVAPAAKGSVKIKKDKNKNYHITVKILHLAPASQLNPPKKTYVVWMVSDNNGTKNIGQLVSSSGFLSKALKGSLNAVTSFKPTGFFITAEDDGATTTPGPTVVLKTK